VLALRRQVARAGAGSLTRTLPVGTFLRRKFSTAATDWTEQAVYSPTRTHVDDAYTLPGSVYSDEVFHGLETQRVWHSSWVCVAELADMSNSGDVIPGDVAGTPILLANDGGHVRAFRNDGGAFDEMRGVFEGPLSDVTQVQVKRQLSDVSKQMSELTPLRVGSAMGLVFVNVNGEAPTLTEWLGDLVPWLTDYEEALKAGELIATHRTSYDIKANWKLLIENFLEYYHLPAVHPALCNVSGVDEHQRYQGKGMYMGFATHPLTVGGTAIDPGRLPPFPSVGAHRHKSAYHISIFPNVFFSLYPEAFFRVRLSQSSPGRTLEHATLQTHAAALEAPNASAILQEIFAFWDNVNTEDILICENVQEGTKSLGYNRGRFSFRFEEPLHRFQNMVVDKMLCEDETRYRIPEGDEETTFLDLSAQTSVSKPKESTVAVAQRARAAVMSS